MEIKFTPVQADLRKPIDCKRGRIYQLFTTNTEGPTPSGRYYMVAEVDGNQPNGTAGWYFVNLESGYMLSMGAAASTSTYMFQPVEAHVVIGAKS